MSDLRPVSEIINDNSTDAENLLALVADLIESIDGTRDIRPGSVTNWTAATSRKFPQLITATAVTYRRDPDTGGPTDTDNPTVVRVWHTTRDDIVTSLVDWATETLRYVNTQPTSDVWLATATRVLAGLHTFPPMVEATTGPDDLVIDTDWLAHILTEAQKISRSDKHRTIDTSAEGDQAR